MIGNNFGRCRQEGTEAIRGYSGEKTLLDKRLQKELVSRLGLAFVVPDVYDVATGEVTKEQGAEQHSPDGIDHDDMGVLSLLDDFLQLPCNTDEVQVFSFSQMPPGMDRDHRILYGHGRVGGFIPSAHVVGDMLGFQLLFVVCNVRGLFQTSRIENEDFHMFTLFP